MKEVENGETPLGVAEEEIEEDRSRLRLGTGDRRSMGHRQSRHTDFPTPDPQCTDGVITPNVMVHQTNTSCSTPSVAIMVPDDGSRFSTGWLPPPLTPDVEAYVSRGVLQLGIDLLRELRRSDPGEANVVLSPYAAASALEELLVGSRGRTAAQISAALYIPPGQRVRASLATSYSFVQGVLQAM
ncbi:uncharacterized protein LOC142563486 [Dermacentor variabilis]|uniref:uncharacterized protein LOC142563486 n=1 Tax=Dermacentor variabilis TaxID=34621 RepID=UPI003F5C5679